MSTKIEYRLQKVGKKIQTAGYNGAHTVITTGSWKLVKSNSVEPLIYFFLMLNTATLSYSVAKKFYQDL